MAISYPVTPPDDLCRYVSFTMRLRRSIGVTRSPFTGAAQFYEWPFAVWEADLQLQAGRRSVIAPLQAFITSLRGMRGTFLMGPMQARIPRGTTNQSGVTANGSASAGAQAIAVTGMGAGKTLLRGDFIQVGSDDAARLHMVVEDATANGSGQATLSIEPALRAGVSGGASVVVLAPKGAWRLMDNALGFTFGLANVSEPVTIPCIENLTV